jgi:hypothetical protein
MIKSQVALCIIERLFFASLSNESLALSEVAQGFADVALWAPSERSDASSTTRPSTERSVVMLLKRNATHRFCTMNKCLYHNCISLYQSIIQSLNTII